MKQLISQVLGREELAPFQTRRQFDDFLAAYGLAGIEGVYYQDDFDNVISPDKLIGLHLPFYADWLPFWLGRTAHLDCEFGGRDVWQSFYQGTDRTALDRFFGEALEFAHLRQVEYVVFHVGQVSLRETFDYRMLHSDQEVIDEAAKLINRLLDPNGPARSEKTRGQAYQFKFLMENLWWPGLNFKDVNMTKRLLSLVNYPHKGLMLDTGHLLCSNLTIRTAEDAMAYLRQVLEAHREIVPAIQGVHLHQSLSGEYTTAMIERVQAQKRDPISAVARQTSAARELIDDQGRSLPFDYLTEFARSYAHVQRIDCHEAWSIEGLSDWLHDIAPEYLVHEFRAPDLASRQMMLSQQQTFL